MKIFMDSNYEASFTKFIDQSRFWRMSE